MNIFVTNPCPVISAYEHTKRHNIKMILELAQMMSTAHRIFGNNDPILYKQTHTNHPCSVWVRESKENYDWAYAHFKALCELYTVTSGKVHKTEEKLSHVLSQTPPLPNKPLNTFAVAMPDEYRSSNVFESYQNYMNAKLTEWVDREKPLEVSWELDTPNWVDKKLKEKIYE